MLQASSSSKHNAMLGQRILHPKSTNFDEGDDLEKPAAKRPKREVTEDDETSDVSRPSSPSKFNRVIADSDADSEDEDLSEPSKTRRTDLETALPPIETDKEAIEAYEATRAAEQAEGNGLHDRLGQRKWIKGKSSIYVDAFNLALETVLEDESHLFDEAEMTVFHRWRDLSYEAQYL